MVVMDFFKRAAKKSKILKVRNEVEKSDTILERMEGNM
jgi:hypothetical protein